MKFRLMIGVAVIGFLVIATSALTLVIQAVNQPAAVNTQPTAVQTNKGQITIGTLAITDAFARPTALETTANADPSVAMGKVSGVYLTITNTGEQADRLIKIESDIAGATELHETTITNDVAQMRPIKGGITIPAGETVKLATGGKHIMLTQLKREVVLGQTIRVTLTFESGVVITLDVPVMVG